MSFSFDQILALVRQLPPNDKIRLSRALEKEGIQSKLESFLTTFRTDELDEEVIDEEARIVRQQLYEDQANKGHL